MSDPEKPDSLFHIVFWDGLTNVTFCIFIGIIELVIRPWLGSSIPFVANFILSVSEITLAIEVLKSFYKKIDEFVGVVRRSETLEVITLLRRNVTKQSFNERQQLIQPSKEEEGKGNHK